MLDIPLHPAVLTLLATLFTWGVTALGSALVFIINGVNKSFLNTLLGISSGVMIASSIWSLLIPSIEMSEPFGNLSWLVPLSGFAIGGVSLIAISYFLDKSQLFCKKHPNSPTYKRNLLMVSAITLHNIPEGMAIGVAFGSVALLGSGASIMGAIMLAIGIGIQNFPEGAAVSLPLKRDGVSKLKAFAIGQASGIVEPISAMIGFFIASALQFTLPFLLALSAGAMIAVVASELIPEATNEKKNFATIGLIIGFSVMMVLDISL